MAGPTRAESRGRWLAHTVGPAVVCGAALAFALAQVGCEGRGPDAPSTQVPGPTSSPLTSATSTVSTAVPRDAGQDAAQLPAPGDAATPDASPPVVRTGQLRELTWRYPKTAVGPMEVVVAIPTFASDQVRLPVLVVFHGQGEADKGPAKGARGWIDDYWLPRAVDRLHAPPLTKKDFLGFVTEERLDTIHQGLAADPYQGLIVVCPYTPGKLSGNQPLWVFRPLAELVVDELLPRVYRETPALGTPATTGIDGVSLGGRAAVAVALERPEAFGSLSTLQAAFLQDEVPRVTRRVAAAATSNPNLRLRWVTSKGDCYRGTLRAISHSLKRKSVEHTFVEFPGPHDYAFNRGPGVFEMLLWHDRVLRGDTPI